MRPPIPATAHTSRLLLHLASLTGAKFDEARAQEAVRTAATPESEPMEVFIGAARSLFMHADPEWMPLKDALWRSRRDTPVILWSPPLARWIVVTYAGWYRVRITESDDLLNPRTVSRSELLKLLGLDSIERTVEAAVIDPEYHSAHIRAGGPAGEESGHELPPALRFYGFLKCERADIITFLTYSVFAAILYLGGPLAVDAMVSGLAFGSAEGPYVQAILVVALAFAASLILHGLISAFLHYISEIIQRRIFVRTAADLAHRLPRIDAAQLDAIHTPEIVNRFLDIATLQKSVSILLLEGVNIVIAGGFGVLLLALYHPYLMGFALLLGLAILATLHLLGHGAVRTSIAESKVKYDLVNCFEEIGHFPYLFKGPGGQDFAFRRTNELVSDYVSARDAHFRILMRQISGLIVIQVLAGAGLLVIGGYLVLRQEITLGQLVASEIIMASIVSALSKLGKKLEAWYDAMAAVDKLGHIVDLRVERSGGERPAAAAPGARLELDRVAFAYHQDLPVFCDLTLRAPPGSRIALVGPHGAGASTLLDLLFGLRPATAGIAAVDGLDLREWSLAALRRETQLVRRDEIVDASVIENLRLGRDDIGIDEIVTALDRVGLLDALRRRPESLGLRLKIGGDPLSGNQRTRLLLARALVQKPRLLLIDDLFDGLDRQSLDALLDAILAPDLPWTVVIATRDPSVIARCTHTLRLGGPST